MGISYDEINKITQHSCRKIMSEIEPKQIQKSRRTMNLDLEMIEEEMNLGRLTMM